MCLVVLPLSFYLITPPLVPELDHQQPFANWKPDDLRVISAGQFERGHPEIIAVYSRVTKNNLTIRIDFTENISLAQYDMDIDLLPYKTSDNPSADRNSSAGVTINFSDSDEISISSQSGIMEDKGINIHQDEILKSIVLSIPSPLSQFTTALSQANINVFDNNTAINVSSSGWFPLKSTKIIPRAPLVLAFKTVLKTGTPAELLRSWNGAHAGPLGQRHGLEQVFSAVEQYQVPIFLLDITTPERLSALSMLGQLDRLDALYRHELVYLADSSSSDSASWQQVLQINRDLTQGLWPYESRTAYLPFTGSVPRQYQLVIGRLLDTNTIRVWDNRNVIPLPDDTGMVKTAEGDLVWQADHNGLSLPVEAALLESALSPESNDLVVLGGNLPESSWGDSAVIPTAFYRIANTPWIRVLSETNLITWQEQPFSSDSQIQCENILCWRKSVSHTGLQYKLSTLTDRLVTNPGNPVGQLAWSTFTRLTNPELDESTRALNQSYLDQVDRLITAAHWAENPGNIQACDLGLYGSDCILADGNQILFFNQLNGSLITGFVSVGGNVQQWTAPFSQRATALSDPHEWYKVNSRIIDPYVINGSFIPPADSFNYEFTFFDNGIRFTNPISGENIAYTITQNSLTVEQQTDGEFNGSLILAPCPQIYYQAAQIDLFSFTCPSPDACTLAVPGCLEVDVIVTDAELTTIDSFLDSPAYIFAVEDPNKDYPAGHYLPTGFTNIAYKINQTGRFTFNFSK